MRLAWTEYRNGKWQPKRLSERTLDLYPRMIYPEHYTFKGGIDAPTENLVVTIYDSNGDRVRRVHFQRLQRHGVSRGATSTPCRCSR